MSFTVGADVIAYDDDNLQHHGTVERSDAAYTYVRHMDGFAYVYPTSKVVLFNFERSMTKHYKCPKCGRIFMKSVGCVIVELHRATEQYREGRFRHTREKKVFCVSCSPVVFDAVKEVVAE